VQGVYYPDHGGKKRNNSGIVISVLKRGNAQGYFNEKKQKNTA